MRFEIRFLIATAISIFASAARAQCEPRWLYSASQGEGIGSVEGIVQACTIHGQDDGTGRELLVVGGGFAVTGTTASVATWDGWQWRGLPAMTGTYPNVWAVSSYKGEIIAGGRFTASGTTPLNCIARWDGAAWQQLGAGVDGMVRAMAVHEGSLVVGGSFTTASGLTVNRIARWDGSSWHSVGSGMNATVIAITEFEGDVVAAGSFTVAGGIAAARVARWDGNTWQPMGSGVPSAITCLLVHEGDLYAGGSAVRRWDGTNWQVIGAGDGSVDSLCSLRGDLIASGAFTWFEGLTMNRVARWDGAEWSSFGSGLEGNSNYVAASTSYRGDLIVGGNLGPVNSELDPALVRWNGTEWRNLPSGVTYFARAAAEFADDLVIAGDLGGEMPGASGIVRWRGHEWNAFGDTGAEVNAVCRFAEGLIAGGRSFYLGDKNIYIARWDGSAWFGLGDGIGGTSPSVYALTEHEGNLIVGGSFDSAGGEPAANVARWDGDQWHAMGAGFNNLVQVLTHFNGELVAGGTFTRSGADIVGAVAKWNGTAWERFGEPQNAPNGIASMVQYGSELVVGGRFIGPAGTNDIAKSDGTAWMPVGAGFGGGGDVKALCIHNGELIAGGGFRFPGESSNTRRLARWNGSDWTGLEGPSGPAAPLVYALASYRGELICGGDFTTVAGVPSATWARWGSPANIWIAENPVDAIVACGDDAQFKARAAEGYDVDGPLTYRWRRDGIDLIDGPTGSGSAISGAATGRLVIAAATAEDAASYECVISNSCGQATSAPATLSVDDCCPADFDGDGFLTGIDFDLFVYAFEDGDTSADFDHDGFITGIDFDLFVYAFEDGC